MPLRDMPENFQREFGGLLSDVEFIRKAVERLTLTAEVTERRLYSLERSTDIVSSVTDDIKDIKVRMIALEREREKPDEDRHLTPAELLEFRQDRQALKERMDAAISNRRSLRLLVWGFSLQSVSATVFMIIHIILNGGHP